MPEWVTAFEKDKLNENKIKIYNGQEKQIALIRKADQVYALLNKCPHEGCPLKSGALDGYVLKCACHNWGFDIRTGENVDTGEYVDMEDPRVETFKTKISDGKIKILI